MKYLDNIIQLALLSVFLVLMGGCSKVSQSEQPALSQQVTAQTAPIAAECVVNYFQTDSAPYITQQQQYFNPDTGYLKIVSTEPTGLYAFTLNKDNFTLTKQPISFLSGLPASFVNQPLATALFYSFTYGAGILDTNQYATLENRKIEGQWYQPLQVPEVTGGLQITLLRNLGTNRIELVKVDDATSNHLWLLQSYNLRYSKDLDTLVPRKIDVFDIQNGLASKQLIIQFEYKNVVKQ